MKWILKVSLSAPLWADGMYRLACRSLDQYDGLEEARIHGKVVTLTGEPGALIHFLAHRAQDMSKSTIVKVILVPGVEA